MCPWPDHQHFLFLCRADHKGPEKANTLRDERGLTTLTQGRAEFLGAHLIATEERARLGAADVTQRIFQVGVDLNLHKGKRRREWLLPRGGQWAGREGALPGPPWAAGAP